METLKKWSEIHIDEDCRNMTGSRKDGLFFKCVFNKLNGLTLKNCDLNGSKFVTSSIRDALGFTVTLNCLSFRGVTLSELVFDLILSLLCMTTGNDDKRSKLIAVIGQTRYKTLSAVLKGTE
jgi:hypothetical protein